MNTMQTRGRRTLIGALAATAIVAACGAGTAVGDKAGGAGEPVILRMADTGSSLGSNLSYVPAVETFVRRVTELSAGHLRIDMADTSGNSAPDAEQQVVRDVAAGKADLTYVGARAFDTLNVTSFRALQAPMLIDSYALQDAVIKSAMPSQMLDGLKPLGVSGLGMVGGGMLKPIATRPLVSLADWHGITFEAYRSEVGADAIRALGATPTDTLAGLNDGLDDGSIQGYARSLLTYELNGNEGRAPFVTANVNLWPNMIVLVANPASLSRLTNDQRGWLRQAAADAAAGSRNLVDREDQILTAVCGLGAHAAHPANASDADLAALRQEFGPVYARLEQDPPTKSFIEQIETLKQSLPVSAPLSIPAGCSAAVPSVAPSVAPPSDPLAGRWTTAKLTESEMVRAFVAAGGDEKEGHAGFAGAAQHYEVITMLFESGLLVQLESDDGKPNHVGSHAHYDVADDGTLTFSDTDGPCVGTFRYDLSGDTLRLHAVSDNCPGDRAIGTMLFASFPFTRSH